MAPSFNPSPVPSATDRLLTLTFTRRELHRYGCMARRAGVKTKGIEEKDEIKNEKPALNDNGDNGDLDDDDDDDDYVRAYAQSRRHARRAEILA